MAFLPPIRMIIKLINSLDSGYLYPLTYFSRSLLPLCLSPISKGLTSTYPCLWYFMAVKLGIWGQVQLYPDMLLGGSSLLFWAQSNVGVDWEKCNVWYYNCLCRDEFTNIYNRNRKAQFESCFNIIINMKLWQILKLVLYLLFVVTSKLSLYLSTLDVDTFPTVNFTFPAASHNV